MNETTPFHQISLATYRAVHQMHQQQPDCLYEKYRSQSWGYEPHQAAFVERLEQWLGKVTNPADLSCEVDIVLGRLVMPEHLQSSNGQQLVETIRSEIQLLFSPWDETAEENSPQVQPTADSQPEQRQPIAILLLDAENLQPDLQVEAFLAKACTYPLRVKVAFANWRKLGKYDVDLHNRDYDLIHVPTGQDMADGKMLMFGSSIHDRYPTAKEVLVCSSDKVMSNLCIKLKQEGLVVLRVQKQKDEIAVCNSTTGARAVFSTAQPTVPTVEACISQLKQLIQAEQQKTGAVWIKLSRISKLFRDQNGIAVSQVVNIHAPGKKARDLFAEHPQDFVIHQPSEQTELYVSVFDEISVLPSKQTESQQTGCNSKADSLASNKAISSTDALGSRETLEQAIAKIVNDLSSSNGGGSVDLSKLGSQFSILHGRPITSFTKQFNPPQKLLTFLKTCKSLVVKQNGTTWEIRCKAQKASSKGI